MMNYLFAAYTIIWVVLFGYMFTLARRLHVLRGEVEQMQRMLDRLKRD